MKTSLKLITAGLTLAFAAAVPLLNAQPADNQNPPPPPREHGPGGPGGQGGLNIQMLTEQLGLSADQQARIRPLLKKQQEQMKALRDDAALSREQRMEKGRALREESVKAIEAHLTPEQIKKWSEMRARAPRGGERPPRGPENKPSDK